MGYMEFRKRFVYTEQEKACTHDWQAAVDSDGQLVEPPYDVCNSCGDTRS